MRAVIFCVLVATFANGILCKPPPPEHEVRGLIEDTINSTLNAILNQIPDPIVIEDLALSLPEGVVRGYLNVSRAELSGIRNIVASYIKLSLLSLSINMTVDVSALNLNVKYDADITLADLIPLYGAGRMNINIENVGLGITGGAKLVNRISLHDIKVLLSIGDALFDLHGLLNNEEFSALVSTALNDNFARFINENSEVISNIISSVVETLINSILNPTNSQFAEQTSELYEQIRLLKENDKQLIYY